MPGFNICGTGNGPAANLETRRKHRWVFRTLGSVNPAALLVLQSASRPNFKFAEPEMHHDQEVAYFAGKQTWEPVSMKWYDVEQNPDVSDTIYQWLRTVVDLPTATVYAPSVYKQQATLEMVGAAGNTTETWIMCNAWPKEVNWGDLDYTATDIVTIEATLRYDRAIKG